VVEGSQLVTICHQLKMAATGNYLPPAGAGSLKKP
jgi:hypothetical protein